MVGVKEKKVWFNVFPGTRGERAPEPIVRAGTAERTEAVGALPLYQRRHFRGINHNNHKHIDDPSKGEILATDDQIRAAINAGKPEEIVDHLDALLDKSFFGPCVTGNRLARLSADFEILDKCDITAEDDAIDNAAREFAKEFVKLDAKGTPAKRIIKREEKIANETREYLWSNRAGKAQFQEKLWQDHPLRDQRCSAQKMALETFEKAFSVGARTSHAERVELLKKLVNVLPNLEHHEVAERSAQRRGLRVLEKALKHLTPDETAQVLAHTMDSATSLSNDFSRRFVKGDGWSKASFFAQMSEGASVVGSIGVGLSLHAAGAAAAAATGFGVIPFGVVTAAWALKVYLGIPKQAMGTALYLFSRKLEDLRKDWDKVTPENKEKLTTAFRNMRDSIPDMPGLKSSTASRIYNDKFLDPSDFGTHGAAMELAKKAKHHFVSPFTTRQKSVFSSPAVVRDDEDETDPQEKLRNLLDFYHAEANAAGVSDAAVPGNLYANLLKHTKGTDYANAFGILSTCFERVRGTAKDEAMPEYSNPLTRPKMLEKIVAITKRLAAGDKDFVRSFLSVAQMAGEDCHTNARQIMKRLWDAVLADKAIKGEHGLDDDLALVRLGMGFFREQLLAKERFEVIGEVPESIEAEVGIAVEIALGKRLGLPDPIQGMGYLPATERVTREHLGIIEKNVLEQSENREKFIDFLCEWDPLTKKIERGGTFQSECNAKKQAIRDDFEEINKRFTETAADDWTTGDQAVLDHAGWEVVHADASARAQVIREEIAELLRVWDAGTLGGHEEDVRLPVELIEASAFGASGGVDQDLFDEFKAELAKIERVLDEGPRRATVVETEVTERLQYTASADSLSPINPEDIPAPFTIVDKGAGGDCLFYALGEKAKDIKAVRDNLAWAIQLRTDDERARNRNAHNIVAALGQTPETMGDARGLTYGRHAVPNSVYARLVAIPGIYAGDDELCLYSSLPRHYGKTFVVVDQNGTLSRVRNGELQQVRYTDENKAQVLLEALNEADVALYKTPIHWQQIALPGKTTTWVQDLRTDELDQFRDLLEILKEEYEDLDLTEPQDDTEIADEGVTLHTTNAAATHAVAGGTATDPFNLQRFVTAQGRPVAPGRTDFDSALAELKAGVKMGHWIWYVFPLVQGITHSSTSRRYAISSLQEAQAYLADPVLGPRLRDCANEVLGWMRKGRTLEVMLGKTDAWKFMASMTLFAEATRDNPTGPDQVFHDCVAIHQRESRTDQLLGILPGTGT